MPCPITWKFLELHIVFHLNTGLQTCGSKSFKKNFFVFLSIYHFEYLSPVMVVKVKKLFPQ